MTDTAAAAAILRDWPVPPAKVVPLAAGHINDTYIVDSPSSPDRFVLQRVNKRVFRRPRTVMRNIAKALAHDRTGLLVAPLPTATGEPFVEDAAADLWRLYPFVPSRCFQDLPEDLIAPAGAAFGQFHAAFADFNDSLEPAIDGFHDLGRFLAAFDATPTTPDAAAARRQVDALRDAFAPTTGQQVIHGDGKVNNLLFHPTENTVVAIIDLDTLMVGDPAWDFGDLARSVFIGAEEAAGARPLSLARFERLCQGFAAAHPEIDDPARYASAPAYMSFMLAVRFLTDHLQGDRYFKVRQRGDNLPRALAQLQLARQCQDAVPAFTEALQAAIAAS